MKKRFLLQKRSQTEKKEIMRANKTLIEMDSNPESHSTQVHLVDVLSASPNAT